MKTLKEFILESNNSPIIQLIKNVGKVDFSKVNGNNSTDKATNQEQLWCDKFNELSDKYIAKTSKEALSNWNKDIDATDGDIYIYDGDNIIYYIDLKVSDENNKNRLGTITLKSLSSFSKTNTDKKMYLCCSLDGTQNPAYVNPKALYDILTNDKDVRGKEIEICNTKHPETKNGKEVTYTIQGIKYNVQCYIKGNDKGYCRRGFGILY